jgi:CheY-like chemotaxis protein
MVEAMDGVIEVTSEVGVGSTFHFRIPLQPGRVPRGSAAAELASPEVQPLLAGRRLLVVDDNATNREVLARLLQLWHCPATLADSGPAALDRLAGAHAAGDDFEVILLDVQMPDMDGVEVAQRLLDEPQRYGRPKIVFLSSLDASFAAQMSQNQDRVWHLTKPVKRLVLRNLLHNILESAAAPAVESSAAAGKPGAMIGAHVLLVEDNAVNRRVARGMLQKYGCTVVEAEDGQIALQLIGQAPFDIVLMDVQMPVLDGLEATRRLRSDPRYRNIPIVAMTAHAMKGDRERCLAAGMNDYLTKPVKAAAVAEMLRKWCKPGSKLELAAAR